MNLKIYYSGIINVIGPEEEHLMPKVGVLLSYYLTKKLVIPPYCDSLFFDSGAFSAYNKKDTIDLQAYIEFIQEHSDDIDVYAALDVVGSPTQSLRNYLKMREAGLDPLPCVHYGEAEHLVKEYRKYTKYIALGGAARQKVIPKRVQWMDPMFANNPDVEFHGFGVQETRMMFRYPWRSVDGTYVQYTATSGGIRTPFGHFHVGKAVKPNTRMQYKKRLKPNVQKKIAEWVESLGIPFKAVAASDPKSSRLRCVVNVQCLEQRNRLRNERQEFTRLQKGFGLEGAEEEEMRRTK